MEELLELAGFSLGYAINLYKSESVETDSLCLLVVQRGDNRKMLTFVSDDVRESHQKATDCLRNLEEDNGYDMAALTYDGYLTTNGAKEETLITQIFTTDSYANRRVAQTYTRQGSQLILKGEPFSNEGWDCPDHSNKEIGKIVKEFMIKEIKLVTVKT